MEEGGGAEIKAVVTLFAGVKFDLIEQLLTEAVASCANARFTSAWLPRPTMPAA